MLGSLKYERFWINVGTLFIKDNDRVLATIHHKMMCDHRTSKMMMCLTIPLIYIFIIIKEGDDRISSMAVRE